jgi:hypothetical protein
MTRGRSMSLVALVGLLLAVGQVAAASPPRHDHSADRSRAVAPALTIPPGTDIPITLDVNVTLNRDQVGNAFPAHLTRDVMVGGAVAIPAGSPAEVALIESEDTPGAASFRLERIAIGGQMRSVRTDLARADASTSGSSTGRKAGIGALAGGALGLVLGGGDGLLKGAAAGAGGGLAWGLLDRGNRRVEHDTRLLFSVRDSVRVP